VTFYLKCTGLQTGTFVLDKYTYSHVWDRYVLTGWKVRKMAATRVVMSN